MRKSAPPAKATRAQWLNELWLALVIGLFIVSLWPTLAFEPSGLDDRALLERFSGASFARVWDFDHFGHLRPLKNLYFWSLARWPELGSSLRALNMLAAVACAWLMRSLSLRLGLTPLWAALAAGLWLLNPTTAVGVSWLAASNHLFALLGMLVYLLALECAGAWRVAATSRRGRVLWFVGHAALLFAVLSHELALLAALWLVLRYALTAKQTGASVFPAAQTANTASKSASADVAVTPKQATVSAQGFAPTLALALPVCAGAAAVLTLPCALRLLHTAPQLLYRSSLPAPQLMASAAHNLALNLRLWLWLQGRFGVLLSQTATLEPLVSSAAWLGAILIGCGLWKLAKVDAVLAQALIWVLLFLVPLINLIPIGVTPVAMHYLILPGLGLSWLTATAIARVTRRSQRLTLLLGAALLLSWQPAFHQTIQAFRSNVSLYETSLDNYPDNLEVRVNLITAYAQAGERARAQQLLDSSLQLAPQHPGLLKQQIIALVQQGRLTEASAWFDQRADQVQRDPDLSLRRALVLRQLGRNQEAKAQFEHVLSIATQAELRALAGYQLASLHVQAGRLSEAQALLRRLHDELPESSDITLALKMIDETLQP